MTAANNQAQKPQPKFSLWRLWPLLMVVGALTAFFAFDLDRYFSIDALRENRVALKAYVAENYWLAIAAFIGIYTLAVSISFPGASILTIAGGLLFGLWGTAATVLGATVGATIVFLIAKTSLGVGLRAAAGSFVQRFEEGFKEGEFSYMLALRLVPAFPFWVVNIVPALLNANLGKYVLATALGIIPGTFVYTSIGNAAGAVFDEGKELQLTGVMTKPEILLPVAGLIVLSLIPVLYRRFRKPAKSS